MEEFYILTDGKLTRHENTIYFENEKGKTYIPIEKIYDIYAYGQVSVTSQVLNILSKYKVPIHFFDYYGHYNGTYQPKQKLLAGDIIIKQAEHYINNTKRKILATTFVNGASENMKQVLKYYKIDNNITELQKELKITKNITEIMNVEARIRIEYYNHFDEIVKDNDFKFEKRTKQPPKNRINALISFGNSLLYTTALNELYNTHLNPTISYLHEPSQRRYSLTLDLTEIFKPIIIDRLIFTVINKGIITKKHFDKNINSCILTETGKRKFLEQYDKKINSTIKHKELGRKVSYKRLIRLDAYKLEKHVLNIKPYEPFKIWW